MSERLTDEQVRAIRERAEAATPGPWTASFRASFDDYWIVEPPAWCTELLSVCVVGAPQSPNVLVDSVFIAHARTDIPKLLAHINALEAELEAATFAVDPPLDNKPAVIRRFRLTEVSSEDEAE